MKNIILAGLVLFIYSSLIAQSEFVAKPDVDKGFGVLAINKKMEDVKPYLIKTERKLLLDTSYKNQFGGMVSSGWMVDLKKAKMEDYFGLKVQRIEVYFQSESDDNDKPKNENIFGFVVWLDKPANDKAHEEFVGKLYKAYGGMAEYMTTTDGKNFIHNTWWTQITLIRVIYGIEDESGKKMKYYQARFEQAYGG